MSSDEKVRALMILEVIGRPAEHLTETLNTLTEQLSKEEGIELKDKKVNEPVLFKDQKDFYTNFAEVEVEAKGLLHLIAIMFKYMPANVEIIEPENLRLTNNNMNEILNELVRRLHGYDEIARIIQMEKSILEKKLREFLPKENNLDVPEKETKKIKSKKKKYSEKT
jgi:hypothetical protein